MDKLLSILVKLKIIEKVESKNEKESKPKHSIMAFIITIILNLFVCSIVNLNFDDSRYFSIKTICGIILFMTIYLLISFIIERIYLKNKK